MRRLPLRGQRRKKNRPWAERYLQARNVHGEQQQGHRGVIEDLDREWRLADAALQGSSGSSANQGRGGLRPHAVEARAGYQRKNPEGLNVQANGAATKAALFSATIWRNSRGAAAA